jgi:hypothetical protein
MLHAAHTLTYAALSGLPAARAGSGLVRARVRSRHHPRHKGGG